MERILRFWRSLQNKKGTPAPGVLSPPQAPVRGAYLRASGWKRRCKGLQGPLQIPCAYRKVYLIESVGCKTRMIWAAISVGVSFPGLYHVVTEFSIASRLIRKMFRSIFWGRGRSLIICL